MDVAVGVYVVHTLWGLLLVAVVLMVNWGRAVPEDCMGDGRMVVAADTEQVAWTSVLRPVNW